jgi:hypothetical protein
MAWPDVIEALAAIRILCPSPVAISSDTHDAALRIAPRYCYHNYDALVAVAALAANCETLFSEDLQDDQMIDDQLTTQSLSSNESQINAVLKGLALCHIDYRVVGERPASAGP